MSPKQEAPAPLIKMIWLHFPHKWTKRCFTCIDIKLPIAPRKMLSMIGLNAFMLISLKILEDHQTSLHILLKIAKISFKIMMMVVHWVSNVNILIQLMNDFIIR